MHIFATFSSRREEENRIFFDSGTICTVYVDILHADGEISVPLDFVLHAFLIQSCSVVKSPPRTHGSQFFITVVVPSKNDAFLSDHRRVRKTHIRLL